MAPGRIRVFVAGTIHLNRAQVRRFLEDDGYEVVGEAPTRENLVAEISRSEPDAVVVDQNLLGRGMMARVRRAAPDAKIIVFTPAPAEGATAPKGADGYLEKGVGLAALTALLVRLFTDGTSLPQPATIGAAAAGAGRDTRVAAAPGSDGPPSSPVGALPRLITIATGAVLIVWGLIAMIATGGVAPPPADPTDTTRPRTVVVAAGSLDEAYDALDELTAALRDGNYVLATIRAQTLMDERRQAIFEGYSLTELDAAVAVRLESLVGVLPLRVNTTLADILRSLYPVLPDEDTPGGGSGVVIGPTTGLGPFTDAGDPDTNGGQNDGEPPGDGDGISRDDGGPRGDGDGGLDGHGNGSHGNGNAWGHVKHESDGPSGGHGNAYGHDKDKGGGPSSSANGNGNGNANGHEKKAKHHS